MINYYTNNIINPVTGNNYAKENFINKINGISYDPVVGQTQQTNEAVEEEDGITIDTGVPFNAMRETTKITSFELATQISTMFKTVFYDYLGSFIRMNNGKILIDLYFIDREKDNKSNDQRPKSVVNLTQANISDISVIEMKRIINNRYNDRLFDLNDETKELLSKFMPGTDKSDKNKNWENYISIEKARVKEEYASLYRNGRYAEYLAVKVSGLDIYKILKTLYGKYIVQNSFYNTEDIKFTRNENGKIIEMEVEAKNKLDFCEYKIQFDKYTTPVQNLPVFIMDIVRYNPRGVAAEADKEFKYEPFMGTPITCV